MCPTSEYASATLTSARLGRGGGRAKNRDTYGERRLVTAEDALEVAATGIVPVVPRTFTAMMEQLQEGYISCVAATAGCSVEFIRRDLYLLDALIIRSTDEDRQEVSVVAQLKNTTTISPDPSKPYFTYQFRNRDHLRRLTMHRKDPKAILLVMTSPRAQADWTQCDHESLTVRNCCYWVSLEDQTVRPDVKYPSIQVPTSNIFNDQALTMIMDKLDRGEALT